MHSCHQFAQAVVKIIYHEKKRKNNYTSAGFDVHKIWYDQHFIYAAARPDQT